MGVLTRVSVSPPVRSGRLEGCGRDGTHHHHVMIKGGENSTVSRAHRDGRARTARWSSSTNRRARQMRNFDSRRCSVPHAPSAGPPLGFGLPCVPCSGAADGDRRFLASNTSFPSKLTPG